MIENINNIIRQWLLEAASLCRDFPHEQLNVVEKSPGHCVTDLDLKIDGFLRAKIQTMFPEHNIISEEGENHYHSKRPFTWLLDPIDGTSYLIKGLPEYSIVVMLLYENKPLAIGIMNPLSNALWVASASQFEAFIPALNRGAYADKILVSPNLLSQFDCIDLPIKSVGSIAYRICMAVSCHSLGAISLHHLSCWDVLPGVFIAHLCGYEVMDLHGRQVDMDLIDPESKTKGLIITQKDNMEWTEKFLKK